MPRTIVDIPEEQLREVARICSALNISRAEAVRRGLSEFIRHHSSVREDGFGLWLDDDAVAADPAAVVRGRW